jgi:hypothetical protein
MYMIRVLQSLIELNKKKEIKYYRDKNGNVRIYV